MKLIGPTWFVTFTPQQVKYWIGEGHFMIKKLKEGQEAIDSQDIHGEPHIEIWEGSNGTGGECVVVYNSCYIAGEVYDRWYGQDLIDELTAVLEVHES